MPHRLKFLLNRLRERLWVKPLAMALLSTAWVFLAHVADGTRLRDFVPDISDESIGKLLEILSASMLVIATFAVASMVAAYSSAATTATPRAFVLVVADDVSQTALSRFIGAFIFSVIALIALKNSYYDKAGLFALFAVTVGFFFLVVTTFVRWVDSIARLGRLGNTIAKVEQAAAKSLKGLRTHPHMSGVAPRARNGAGHAVHATEIGYVQHVNIAALQSCAEKAHARVLVETRPGAFASPSRCIARIFPDADANAQIDTAPFVKAFVVGDARTFDDDPRFGLIVLSEIASRALSPAVNDPGTAIDVLGRMLRLIAQLAQPGEAPDEPASCDRVEVAGVAMEDVFDDAFNAIARDGAGTLEVMLRLQKALGALGAMGEPSMRENAIRHARMALARAEEALALPEDLAKLRAASRSAMR